MVTLYFYFIGYYFKCISLTLSFPLRRRYPWGEEAIKKAKEENKLIFLSVGYSTCHWCHVMEKESFEDENVAELMNSEFINIKVDREERPDVDKMYMSFVQVRFTRFH
jgi:uncharacterized protein YyaL (SSP411 family)